MKEPLSTGKGKLGRILILLLLIGAGLMPSLVSAAVNDTILCFSDPGYLSHDTLVIYGLNGSAWELMGTFNSSSCGVVLSPGQYQITKKVTAMSITINDPSATFLEGPSDYILDHINEIILLVVCVGIVLIAWRRK